jgi:hypothetical protein
MPDQSLRITIITGRLQRAADMEGKKATQREGNFPLTI